MSTNQGFHHSSKVFIFQRTKAKIPSGLAAFLQSITIDVLSASFHTTPLRHSCSLNKGSDDFSE